MAQTGVELDDQRRRGVNHLGLAVVGSFRGRDDEPHDQRGQGREKSKPQFHDILGFIVKMAAGQALAKKAADQRAGHHEQSHDQGNKQWTHRPLSILTSSEPAIPVEGVQGRDLPPFRPSTATDRHHGSHPTYFGNMNCTWARICQFGPLSGVTTL